MSHRTYQLIWALSLSGAASQLWFSCFLIMYSGILCPTSNSVQVCHWHCSHTLCTCLPNVASITKHHRPKLQRLRMVGTRLRWSCCCCIVVWDFFLSKRGWWVLVRRGTRLHSLFHPRYRYPEFACDITGTPLWRHWRVNMSGNTSSGLWAHLCSFPAICPSYNISALVHSYFPTPPP